MHRISTSAVDHKFTCDSGDAKRVTRERFGPGARACRQSRLAQLDGLQPCTYAFVGVLGGGRLLKALQNRGTFCKTVLESDLRKG